MISINEQIKIQNNAFSFLRFLLASFVILSHTYFIGGYGIDPLWKYKVSFGSLAVEGFFALSGFLIMQSFLSSKNIFHYILKRLLRIFPSYWVCLLTTGLFLAPIIYFITHNNFSNFTITSNPFINYVGDNFLLLVKKQTIEGIFINNPYKGVINGSLWILFPLFCCYLILPILALFRILKRNSKILFLLFFCFVTLNAFEGLFFNYFTQYPITGIARSAFEFQRYFAYFLGGCILFLFASRIPINNIFFVFVIFILIGSILLEFYNIIGPFILPYVLVGLAIKLPIKILFKNFDISYGMYIYAFPIQQTLYFFNFNVLNPILFFLISLICTAPLAILNLYFVEKPISRLKAVL